MKTMMFTSAKFVMLIIMFTLTFSVTAQGLNRIPARDEIDREDELIPPPTYPGGIRGRIPREPLADYDGEGEVDSESGDTLENDPYTRPAYPGSTATNSRFGETINKIEFKLVSPEDEAKPKNPRAASYERYKKYKQN